MTEKREGVEYMATIPAGWTVKAVNGTLYGVAPDQKPHVLTMHASLEPPYTRWTWEPVELKTADRPAVPASAPSP